MTIDKILDALGGVMAVSKALGLSYQAVHNWIQVDHIPGKHALRIWAMCAERGVAWQPPGTEGWTLVRGDGS